MRILILILVAISVISCSRGTFSRGTLGEWSKAEAPNRLNSLNYKGINNLNGYELIEKREQNNPNILVLEYYLKKPDGDSWKLGFEVNGTNELKYFEFHEEGLFILIHQAGMVDKVHLYNINVQTGQINFQTTGQLPCKSKFEFNWKMGNTDCEWLNFNAGKIALAHMGIPFKSQLAVYNWRVIKYEIIDTELNVGLSSNTDFIVEGDVCYNTMSKKFESKNDY